MRRPHDRIDAVGADDHIRIRKAVPAQVAGMLDALAKTQVHPGLGGRFLQRVQQIDTRDGAAFGRVVDIDRMLFDVDGLAAGEGHPGDELFKDQPVRRR